MGKILLVDDHPDIVRLLEVSLRGEGHSLFTADNGLRALELIESEVPDVVILDVVMPELDGFRVLHRVKTNPRLRHICIIMLTVKDQPEDMFLGIDMGADFYLAKPFRPGDITSLVRRIFETRGQTAPPP